MARRGSSPYRGNNFSGDDSHSEFCTLWKDADPDIPVLKEAKAEYATLH